jgi:hypothetical protein
MQVYMYVGSSNLLVHWTHRSIQLTVTTTHTCFWRGAVAQLIKILSPLFMNTDGTLLCSSMPATGQYPHAAEFGPSFALSFLSVSFFLWRFDPIRGHGRSLRRLVITLIGHKTLGRTPLHKWSARRRKLWQHTTLIRDKTAMPPAGFEPKIAASERLQTNELDRAATGDRHFLNTHANNIRPSKTMASRHLFGSGFPLSALCALHVPHP